jgi:hypothetical protein
MKTNNAPAIIASSAVFSVSIILAAQFLVSETATAATSQVSVLSSISRSSTTSASRTSKSSSSASSKVLQGRAACMVKAAQKREEAIQQSLDTFYNDMSTLLGKRKTQVLKFWALDDAKKRDDGLRSLWRNFGQAWRKSNLYMRDQQRLAWEAYRNAKSDCGLSGNDPEKGGLGADSQF